MIKILSPRLLYLAFYNHLVIYNRVFFRVLKWEQNVTYIVTNMLIAPKHNKLFLLVIKFIALSNGQLFLGGIF